MRGIWSLMTVCRLMQFIAEEEERMESLESHGHRGAAHTPCSSFRPLAFPANLMIEDDTRASDSTRRVESLRCPSHITPSHRYLPCHYFDFVGGSSTGR